MKRTYLEFEKPVETLEAKIESLKKAHDDHPTIDVNKELNSLQEKLEAMQHKIFDNLTAWQISQVSRHPQRPYTQDYIQAIFKNFKELHGDRAYSDDPAIIGGLAEFEGQSVMVIGHQKGRDIKERQHRNFGMPRPEGYRKALRLFKLAEKFSLPIITLIDTPGAYPGLEAEERGQGEAIARNIIEMTRLKVPIIVVIIGEGASGGALGIGVGDKVLMLENTWYSVISPESCSSILWRSWDHKEEAAEALKLTAKDMLKNKLIDKIINEPLGGAHYNPSEAFKSVKENILYFTKKINSLSKDKMIELRRKKFTNIGNFKG